MTTPRARALGADLVAAPGTITAPPASRRNKVEALIFIVGMLSVLLGLALTVGAVVPVGR